MTRLGRVVHVVHRAPGAGVGGAEAILGRLARAQRDSWDVVLLDLGLGERHAVAANDPRAFDLARPPRNRPRPFGGIGYAPDRAALGEIRRRLDSLAPDVVHLHWTGLIPVPVVEEILRTRAARVVRFSDFTFACANHILVRFDGSVCAGPGPAARNCGECYGQGLFQRLRGAHPRTYSRLLTGPRARTFLEETFRALRFPRRMSARLAACTRLLQACDALIAPAAPMREWLVRAGAPADRVEVLPSPVPANLREIPCAPPPPPLRLGYLGRIIPTKGVELAVRVAIETAPEGVTLDVFGPFDPARDAYHRRLRELAEGAPVRFRGPYGDPAEPLSQIHALLVPSTWPENSPNVLREALAAGVPVLASDVAGIRDDLHDGAGGWLLPAGDLEAWRRRVREIAREPDRLSRLGPPASPLPTEAEYARAVDRLYERALARTHAPRGRPSLRTCCVVVQCRGEEHHTRPCLSSLIGQDSLDEIVLVDNASRDGSVERLRSAFPRATILENERNLGYTGGNNRGIRHALRSGARYVFVLNNDTEVDAGAVRRLVEFMESHPVAAAAQPLVVRHEAPDRIDSAGLEWDDSGGAHNARFREPAAGVGTRPFEVAASCGSALMLRAEALKEVGLLEEPFFILHEEVDLAWRLGLAGWRSYVVPEARVRHKGGLSQKAARPRAIQICYRRNRLLVLLRYWPLGSIRRFLPIHLSNAVRLALLRPPACDTFRAFLRSLAIRLTRRGPRWRQFSARWLRPAPALRDHIRAALAPRAPKWKGAARAREDTPAGPDADGLGPATRTEAARSPAPGPADRRGSATGPAPDPESPVPDRPPGRC